MSRLSDIHRYFSRLDLSLVKGKSKVIDGPTEKELKLEAERKALRLEVTAASDRIKALEAEMVVRDSELVVVRTKAGKDAAAISHLEGLVKDLERKVSAADMERKAHGRFQFKQGCREGLKAGLDKGFRAGYAEFPLSRDMRAIVEGYKLMIFCQIWHSMLFVQKAAPMAESFLEGQSSSARRSLMRWFLMLGFSSTRR